MGYCTRYELSLFSGDKAIHEILAEVDDGSFDGLWYAVDENGESTDSVKWYDHEDDMKLLSKKYPDIVFKLTGEGEEAGDIWIKYFKNGKMQSCYAIITYEEYNESELK